MDKDFTMHGQAFKIEMPKSKDIDDMKEVARTKDRVLNSAYASDISIWKILEPVPISPHRTRSQRDISSSSSPHNAVDEPATKLKSVVDLVQVLKERHGTLDNLLEQLETTSETIQSYIAYLYPQEDVGNHFKGDNRLIQALVVHPVVEGESYLIYDVR